MLQRSLALLLALFITVPLFSSDKVSFSISPANAEFSGTEVTKISLNMSLFNDWYSYGITPKTGPDGLGPQATEIYLPKNSPFTLKGKVQESKPIKKYDEGFEIEIDVHKKKASFTLPLQLTKAQKPGKYQAAVLIYYQLCVDERCLPPQEDTVYFSYTVTESKTDTSAIASATEEQPAQTVSSDSVTADSAAVVASVQTADTTATSAKPVTGVQMTEANSEIQRKKEEGIGSFIWFAMGAGATALLTPCVFPMVPITVSYFTKRAEKQKSKAHGVRDSLIYAAGIISTFTAIGFVLALLLGASGITDFATNPVVNLAIAALFLVFAFNLFGAFEIQIPTAILNKLNSTSSEKSGIMGILLMGLTFSLTSFTCTVPFVGSALISAADGEWFYPIIGMLGFSSVFALPFFLLALFPSAMASLPKAGGWMNNIKVVMGFLEVAAAMKFISNSDLVWGWGVLSREVFLAIWIACGFLVTMYILGSFRMKLDSPLQSVGGIRAAWAVIFASVTFYLIGGLFGNSMGELDAFIPPKNYDQIISGTPTSSVSEKTTVAGTEVAEKEWISSYEEGLKIAQETGKNVFIDFTGFTCTNCRWMESNIFPKPEVASLMNSMVKVQLFTDRRNEPYISNRRLQQERFGSIEMPLYVILKPDGSVISTKAFTRNVQEFTDFLKKGVVSDAPKS